MSGSRVGEIYDRVAEAYERHMARDEWMRFVLHRHFARQFNPGDRVLDVGCGTGRDTIFLASRGIRVTGVDASLAMLRVLADKLAAHLRAGEVEIHAGDALPILDRLVGPFDGIVSSFAALNSIDLSAFAAAAARLLRPRGRAIIHMLAPGYFGRGHRGSATVTVGIGVNAEPLDLTLRDVEETLRVFAHDFVPRDVYGLGLLVGGWAQAHLPQVVLRVLGTVEVPISRVRSLGRASRFIVLDLERRADSLGDRVPGVGRVAHTRDDHEAGGSIEREQHPRDHRVSILATRATSIWTSARAAADRWSQVRVAVIRV